MSGHHGYGSVGRVGCVDRELWGTATALATFELLEGTTARLRMERATMLVKGVPSTYA